MTASYFISDLHLADERPDSTETLLRFLNDIAPSAQRLFILGDLFEYWIGDEALDLPMPAQVASALRELGSRGTSVSYLHGNRDFLLGERFSREAGLQLLPDPYKLVLHGVPTLLMHGDTLCTDDVEYLKFRHVVRNPDWQTEFLAKPIPERIQLAQAARSESEQAKKGKSMTIMDVSDSAVEAILREHAYPRLIHGHTHRPAFHRHLVDSHECERIVLADWYGNGSYLECNDAGCRNISLA